MQPLFKMTNIAFHLINLGCLSEGRNVKLCQGFSWGSTGMMRSRIDEVHVQPKISPPHCFVVTFKQGLYSNLRNKHTSTITEF